MDIKTGKSVRRKCPPKYLKNYFREKNSWENCEVITGACQSVIAMTVFLNTHQEVHMKVSIIRYSFVAILSVLMLTGFTCSKHVPEKAPENSVPQDEMTTDQTTSSDATPVNN